MPNPKYNFDSIDSMKAEAIGPPGQRRFKIAVVGRHGSADLWLEKNQLLRLSVAIKQEIINIGSPEPVYQAQSAEYTRDPNREEFASFEIDIGNISLLHMQKQNLFAISVYEIEDTAETEPYLEFTMPVQQLNLFAEQAQELCAAGRPLCPLCNSPMGTETHRCARSNGHNSN